MLTITAGRSLLSLLFDESILELLGGNRRFMGRVTLDGAAPNGGTNIALSLSSGTGSLVGVTVPKSVSVAEGQTTASFPFDIAPTARSGTVVTVTATLGKVSLKQNLTVP
jgi:hypothetical protein